MNHPQAPALIATSAVTHVLSWNTASRANTVRISKTLQLLPNQRALATILAGCLLLACSPDGRTGDSFNMVAEVVAEYPHDSSAFTQGLVIHDGRLFEGTGQYGASTLREVALETGEVLRAARLSQTYFGEGITIIGERVFQLTWRAGIGAVYDLETFEISNTFRYSGEGWGLTHDNSQLILSDGTSTLRFLDPDSFEVTRELDVTGPNGPVSRLNELEYVRGEIWANVWYEDFIVRIDPDTGAVTGTIDLTNIYPPALRGREEVANGIAFDAGNEKIYITGKNWPRLYEIRLVSATD
jgi:glutamine cyclotransferase